MSGQILIPAGEHLLPPSSTPEERIVGAASRRITDIPTPLRALWRPDDCPPIHLPWLAWALSVDIWDDNWTVEQKRSIIRQSFELHRLKGTLGGIRRYVSLAGSEVYRAIKPPAKNFLGESTTPAEREAYLRSLPQVRIYTHVRRSYAGKRAFFNAKVYGRFFQDSLGRKCCFPVKDQNGPSLQRRAEYVENGVRSPISWTKLDVRGERVFLPGINKFGVFSGQTFLGAKRFFVKSTASTRIVTLDLTRTTESDLFLYRFPVVASETPVHAYPLREFDPAFNRYGVFSGRPFGGKFFVPSTAALRTYDVVHLRRDPTEGRQVINHMGTQRFGQPPYTGEIKLAVTSYRKPFVANRFMGVGYFYASPKTELKKALAAIRSAKAARDTIEVNTSTYRPLRMGTTLLLGGELRLGSFTRS